jgi:peptidoglycan/LPS O-acetylase OafA/YrhL
MNIIRGVAALGVVFFHLNEGIEHRGDWYDLVCRLGYLGVPAFFVVSGWCMRSLQTSASDAGSFMAARLIRIYPPYLVSLLITVTVLVVNKLLRGVNDLHVSFPADLQGFLALGLMLPSPATAVSGLNWSYWTLPVELAFYLITALGVLLATTLGNNSLKLAMIDVALVVSLLVKTSGIKTVATMGYWTPYFMMFALGVYAFHACQARHGDLATTLPCLARLMLTVALIIVTTHDIGSVVVALLAFGVLTAEACLPAFQAILQTTDGVSAPLGAYSYSLYLLHVPLGCWFLARYRTLAILSQPTVHLLADSVIVVCLVVVAWLFYTYVELPFHTKARSVGRKLSA